jgi:hypothetical protein
VKTLHNPIIIGAISSVIIGGVIFVMLQTIMSGPTIYDDKNKLLLSVGKGENNGNCMNIDQIKNQISFNLKLPTYLPKGYEFECGSGRNFDLNLLYKNNITPQDKSSGISLDLKQIQNGAISIMIIDEKDMLGKKNFEAEHGNITQIEVDMIQHANEKNPSINLQLVKFNGNIGWANDGCNGCGKQIANFSNNTIADNTFPVPSRIQFYDENGIIYFVQADLPLDELMLVAESIK